MFPIFLKIGPLTLHTYGLLVASGFLIGMKMVQRDFKALRVSPEVIDQLVLTFTLSALFGARLGYFLMIDPTLLFRQPLEFFKIWEGGLVYYAALIGSLLGAWVYCRIKKISFFTFSDVFSAPLLLAQSIGRLGCFAAGCCYGKPTDSFLGVQFTHSESLAPTFISLHPTQIYSSLALFLLFIGIYFISQSKPQKGVLTAYYLIGYGVFRFLIEFLRDDYRGIVLMHLHPSQWISVGAIFLGAFMLYLIYGTKKLRSA